jgi:hypothetical protein
MIMTFVIKFYWPLSYVRNRDAKLAMRLEIHFTYSDKEKKIMEFSDTLQNLGTISHFF